MRERIRKALLMTRRLRMDRSPRAALARAGVAVLACALVAGCVDEHNANTLNEPVQSGVSAAKANKLKGEEFLAANAKKEGVKTTPSGVQYIVLKEGTGKKPTKTDEVEVHYTGTLIDGTKFDSSVDRGEPASLAVNHVIPGWTEVLQMMQEGAKWKVFIPSEQAYKRRGSPPKIGPNETLIFDIELLHVK